MFLHKKSDLRSFDKNGQPKKGTVVNRTFPSFNSKLQALFTFIVVVFIKLAPDSPNKLQNIPNSKKPKSENRTKNAGTISLSRK